MRHENKSLRKSLEKAEDKSLIKKNEKLSREIKRLKGEIASLNRMLDEAEDRIAALS